MANEGRRGGRGGRGGQGGRRGGGGGGGGGQMVSPVREDVATQMWSNLGFSEISI